MSESVSCRGCGRRLALPATISRAKARCPKCRTKVEPPPTPPQPDPGISDAYQTFLLESLVLPVVQPPAPPPEVALSLDEAPQPNPKPHPEPPPPPLHFPPPFRVAVHVLADTARQFGGPFHIVLTPHGLFLESEPNRPLLYIPVGCHGIAAGCDLALALPGRRLDLRFEGVGEPEQLAEDTAAFLGGRRPVPLPAEYRPPWWLVGVGAIFALGLATGPVLLAAVSEVLSLGPALGLAAVFAVLTMLANAGIALRLKREAGAKIAAMAGLNAALLGVFLVGAMIFLREDEPAPPPPQAPPPIAPPRPVEPPPTPPQRPPGEVPPPVTHHDFILRDGRIRLDDGPAAVTAIAALPADGGVLVAYADGSSRIWNFDQPAFEPPRLGPRTPSAVRRITFDSAGKFAMLACDTGLVFVSLGPVNRTPVVVPGEFGVAFFDPNRDRFAVVRNDRVHIRYLPMDLVKNPPAGRAKGGFVTLTPQDETLPLNVPPMGLATPGGKPTFLVWHPGGRLLAGRPDGSIASLALGGGAPFASSEHRAAVRAWNMSANGDLAFGDAEGFVGYWPNRTTKIAKFRAGGAAILALAFSFCGGELAVADDSGGLSFWHPETGKKQYELKQKQPVAALCYGPRDDVLLLSSGRGAEAWWLPELERLAQEK